VPNVQKIDITMKRLQKGIFMLRLKCKQTTDTIRGKGWGFRFERVQTETVFEPLDDAVDERE